MMLVVVICSLMEAVFRAVVDGLFAREGSEGWEVNIYETRKRKYGKVFCFDNHSLQNSMNELINAG